MLSMGPEALCLSLVRPYVHNRGPGRRHPPSPTGLLSTGCAGENEYLGCLFSLAGPILRIF